MSSPNDETPRCAVIGHGSWATAIVKILADRGCRPGWYVRNEEVLAALRTEGRNPKYLRDVEFDLARIAPTGDLNEAVAAADTVILAMPSAYLETFLEPLRVPLAGKTVVSAVKGIIPGSYRTVVEHLEQRYGVPPARIALVTGPSHAEEVSLGRLTYLTVGCADAELARRIGDCFGVEYIRLSYTTDIYGLEYTTVLKNIYALAVGLAVGLGYGDNFIAVLIANCAREMRDFTARLLPGERDTQTAAYLGDLLVTCYSTYSRNRRLGLLIGHGCTVKSALNEMTMIAEGYFGTECIHHIAAREGIAMPVAGMVYRVLYEGASARRLMKELTTELI